MPQDAVSDMLKSAKATLADADKKFPTPKTLAKPAMVTPAPKATGVATKAPSTGDELAAKKTMVDKAVQALPKMHDGGPVTKTGAYQLKAGEHVLTAPEAMRARKHALMSTGMRSLAKGMVKPTPKVEPETTAKPKGNSVKITQTVPNTQFQKVGKSTAPTTAAKGDKHIPTAKSFGSAKIRPEGAIKRDSASVLKP